MKRAVLMAAMYCSCGGTTGGGIVQFTAYASGPSDAIGGPLSFDTGMGARVTLSRARMVIGALYLNETVPLSGAASDACINPGVYVAQAFGPVEVDLLSPTWTPFPTRGEGTAREAKSAEVWLTPGDVNATNDSTVILSVAGSARQDGKDYQFKADVTIGANRKRKASNPALPGSAPICQQRIVSPIAVSVTPTDGGALHLAVDARQMFNGVDFSKLPSPSGTPSISVIPDADVGTGSSLFNGMRSNFGVYTISWLNEVP